LDSLISNPSNPAQLFHDRECISQVAIRAEALKNIQEAMEVYLESLKVHVCDLEVIDQTSSNYQPVKDYATW